MRRKASSVLSETASGKEDTPVPAAAQSFVKVLTTYSPPPRKR